MTSDELVRAARERTHAEPTVIDEFVPSSPADAYRLDVETEYDPESSDGPSLTAEEIASALLAATEARAAEEGIRGDAEELTVGTSEPAGTSRMRVPRIGAGVDESASHDLGVDPGSDVAVQLEQGDGSEAQLAPVPPSADFVGDRWSRSTPEWEERVAQRPVKRTRVALPGASVIRAMIGLAVLGFVGLGLVGSWLDGRQAVDDLDVGACFTVGESEDIYDVPVVDCAEPHDSELFALVTVTGFGAVHPGDDALFTWLFDKCLDRFPGYVGEPYESSDYWIDMLIPTEDGWSGGDRVGMCTAITVDDDLNLRPSTGSARNAGTEA